MRYFLIILLVGLLSFPDVYAQKGLHVNSVYEGMVVKKSCIIENLIRGKQLDRYKLHFFRSIKFRATDEERAEIESLVEEDIKQAQDLEMERRGRLNYAMMTLAPCGEKKSQDKLWYLCYQCVPVKNEYDITLVFMKGHATLQEMRAKFKKQ